MSADAYHPDWQRYVGGEPRAVGADVVSGGAKATGGAAEKVDDVVAPSSKPEWLQRLDAGNEFNKVQSKNYPNNEVYIQRPDGSGYYRVDSYNPIKGEIVSRKLTRLSEVSEATAKSYISEAITKYPSGGLWVAKNCKVLLFWRFLHRME
ncbi:hypothetical protein LZ023_08570 [Pseudomonas silvicola]|nr:hypothetical protein LZ023_08570 [Pseudomonas silvicola]